MCLDNMYKKLKKILHIRTSNMKVSTSSLMSKSVKELSRDAAIKRSNMASRFFLTRNKQ